MIQGKHDGGSILTAALMPAKGTGSLVFIDDLIADGSIRMILKCIAALCFPKFDQISQNSMQQDNDPKHGAKATKDLFGVEDK